MMATSKKLTATQVATLLKTLQERFENNMQRHKGLKRKDIQTKLEKSQTKLFSLYEMERTGGEPDVIGYDNLPAGRQERTDTYLFVDCSAESPKGRRSLCYDRESLESRKANRPVGSAVGMAKDMGIEILTEEQYKILQTLGSFDQKTSSWIATPAAVRKHGGALFCDRRYHQVFVYHNGAESYYAARGFRGLLSV